MMVALLLYGYSQGERSSRVIERRCVQGVAYRVITGGLHPDHATIARFRARHETALGGLFSRVLRLLAAEGMVSLGLLSLDGTKLAGNASQKASKTLPQIEQLLAEAAAAGAAEDAEQDGSSPPVTPRAGSGWPRPGNGWPPRTGAAATRSGPGNKPGMPPWRRARGAGGAVRATTRRAPNPNNTEPRANITDPDVRIMRNQKGYVAGYNGQLVVTAQQVIAGAMLSQHPVGRTPAAPLAGHLPPAAGRRGITPRLRTVLADSGYASEENFARADAGGLRLLAPLAKDPARRHIRTPKRTRHFDRFPATARARRRLQHPRGRDGYKMRPRTAEPVFGQLKTCQKLTMMSRRGQAACENEWPLACAAHNLRKLHRHRTGS